MVTAAVAAMNSSHVSNLPPAPITPSWFYPYSTILISTNDSSDTPTSCFEEYTGNIIGDLTSRRGQVQGQEPRGNAIAIDCFVPLANMFGYINNLRSMSSGRANFTMQFDHYEPVPQNISDEIQAKFA